MKKLRNNHGGGRVWAVVIILAVLIGILAFLLFGTAGGRRILIDIKSDFSGGLDRTINVYTANGDLLASYTGKIDLAATEGGYVKFDYKGKRYIYYNCFVETIADIP